MHLLLYKLREAFTIWDCLSSSVKIGFKPLEGQVTKFVCSEFSIKMV